MTTTDTEIVRDADVFGCGGGLDLLERLAVVPEGIGTGGRGAARVSALAQSDRSASEGAGAIGTPTR